MFPMSISGSATSSRISGAEASALAIPPFDSKKIEVATFRWTRSFPDRIGRFIVKTDGMAVFLAADIRRNSGLKPMLAQLLKERCAELRDRREVPCPDRSGHQD